MRFSRLAPLLLSLTLLTACAGRADSPEESVLYDVTGIFPHTVLFTVDRRAVTAEQYFSALTTACDGIQAAYQRADAAVDWGENLSGQTLEDYAREQALASAVLYATVENQGEQFACGLDETETRQLDEEWTQKAAEYGGETAYLDALNALCLSREGARQLAADRRVYLQLSQLSATPGSALHPTDAAAAEFAARQGYVTAEILLLPVADSSAESAALCRKQAQEAADKLRGGGDFAALAKVYGGEAAPVPGGQTFCIGGGTFPQPVEAAVAALAENASGGPVETEAGCYLLRRRALDLSALSDAYFDFRLQAAADAAVIAYESTWNPFPVSEFYAKLTAAREALSGGKT